MIKKIIFSIATITITANAFTIPSTEINKSNNSTEEKKEINEKKISKKADLSESIVANDWFEWLGELSKRKDIDKVSKKKISAGAEIMAEHVSKERAAKINSEIGDNNINWEAHNSEWKVKEQEETMKAIATKLSAMTLTEIIDIYEQYGKKEVN